MGVGPTVGVIPSNGAWGHPEQTPPTLDTETLRDERASLVSVESDAITVVESTAATAIAEHSIPDNVKAGDVLKLTVYGDHLNNSGGSTTVGFNVVIGATTAIAIAALTNATSANRRRWWFTILLVIKEVDEQILAIHGDFNTANVGPTWSSSGLQTEATGTATEDLSAGKDLKLEVTLGNSSSAIDCVARCSVLEYFRS